MEEEVGPLKVLLEYWSGIPLAQVWIILGINAIQ
jgi:hypothetical protein